MVNHDIYRSFLLYRFVRPPEAMSDIVNHGFEEAVTKYPGLATYSDVMVNGSRSLSRCVAVHYKPVAAVVCESVYTAFRNAKKGIFDAGEGIPAQVGDVIKDQDAGEYLMIDPGFQLNPVTPYFDHSMI